MLLRLPPGRRVVGHVTVHVIIARMCDRDVWRGGALGVDLHVPNGRQTTEDVPSQATEPFLRLG